jgi:hypothetical protein
MRVEVKLQGRAEGDVALAARQVASRLSDGQRSGADHNGTGSYLFHVLADDGQAGVEARLSAAEVVLEAPWMTTQEADEFLSVHGQAISHLMVRRGEEALRALLGKGPPVVVRSPQMG